MKKRIYLSKNPDPIPFTSFDTQKEYENYLESYDKINCLIKKLEENNIEIVYYKTMDDFQSYDTLYKTINQCDAVLGVIHGEMRLPWRACEIGDGNHMGKIEVPVFLYFLPEETIYSPLFSGFKAIVLPSKAENAATLIDKSISSKKFPSALDVQRKQYLSIKGLS